MNHRLCVQKLFIKFLFFHARVAESILVPFFPNLLHSHTRIVIPVLIVFRRVFGAEMPVFRKSSVFRATAGAGFGAVNMLAFCNHLLGFCQGVAGEDLVF